MATKIIAIDGFASTGKSTLSKRLAQKLGFVYMDTGYMFRVVSLHVLENGWLKDDTIDEAALNAFLPSLNFHWQQTPEGGNAMAVNDKVFGESIHASSICFVSLVAVLPQVRTYLLEQQRELAKSANVVMDGRDIGTVVFPHADLKFF